MGSTTTSGFIDLKICGKNDVLKDSSNFRMDFVKLSIEMQQEGEDNSALLLELSVLSSALLLFINSLSIIGCLKNA